MNRRAGRNIALHVRENTTLWDSAIRQFEDGDYGAAVETFSSMDYVTAAVTFNIGTAYMALGDYERAIEFYTETLRRDRYFALAYFQRARAFHFYGWNEDALRDLHESHRRLRGNKFIDYHNLGLSHILWECQIIANVAIVYMALGLHRHALHYVDTAYQSREDSFNAKPGNETQQQLEAAVPTILTNDLVTYFNTREDHDRNSCAAPAMYPPPLFRPRGLSSLWLHASQRIKKNYLGKAKVIYCLGSQKEAGFAGAQAKAAGQPLPIKSPMEKSKNPLSQICQTFKIRPGKLSDQPRSCRANSDSEVRTAQRSKDAVCQSDTHMRSVRSNSTPSTGTLTSQDTHPVYDDPLPITPRGAQQPYPSTNHTKTVSNVPMHGISSSGRNASKPPPLPPSYANYKVIRKQAQESADTQDDHELLQVLQDVSSAMNDDNEEEEEDDETEQAAPLGEEATKGLSKTEKVALAALQVLSEQLQAEKSRSGSSEAILKAISDLTQQLESYVADEAEKDESDEKSNMTGRKILPRLEEGHHAKENDQSVIRNNVGSQCQSLREKPQAPRNNLTPTPVPMRFDRASTPVSEDPMPSSLSSKLPSRPRVQNGYHDNQFSLEDRGRRRLSSAFDLLSGENSHVRARLLERVENQRQRTAAIHTSPSEVNKLANENCVSVKAFLAKGREAPTTPHPSSSHEEFTQILSRMTNCCPNQCMVVGTMGPMAPRDRRNSDSSKSQAELSQRALMPPNWTNARSARQTAHYESADSGTYESDSSRSRSVSLSSVYSAFDLPNGSSAGRPRLPSSAFDFRCRGASDSSSYGSALEPEPHLQQRTQPKSVAPYRSSSQVYNEDEQNYSTATSDDESIDVAFDDDMYQLAAKPRRRHQGSHASRPAHHRARKDNPCISMVVARTRSTSQMDMKCGFQQRHLKSSAADESLTVQYV